MCRVVDRSGIIKYRVYVSADTISLPTSNMLSAKDFQKRFRQTNRVGRIEPSSRLIGGIYPSRRRFICTMLRIRIQPSESLDRELIPIDCVVNLIDSRKNSFGS